MSRFGMLARKLGTLRRLPAWVWLGLLPTWLMLGLARLLVLSVPFQRIAQVLGRHAGPLLYVPLLPPEQQHRVRQLSTMVQLMARYAPWQANCFAQAITARLWLACLRLPGAIYFGVCKLPDGSMQAHAWVCSGPVAVTGGRSFGRFTVVATFLFPAHG